MPKPPGFLDKIDQRIMSFISEYHNKPKYKDTTFRLMSDLVLLNKNLNKTSSETPAFYEAGKEGLVAFIARIITAKIEHSPERKAVLTELVKLYTDHNVDTNKRYLLGLTFIDQSKDYSSTTVEKTDISAHAVSIIKNKNSTYTYYDPNLGELEFRNLEEVAGFIEASYPDKYVSLKMIKESGSSSTNETISHIINNILNYITEHAATIKKLTDKEIKPLSGMEWITEWDKPNKELFIGENIDYNETFNYEKQLIIQLQGDTISFESSKALFAKHPKQSEWLQLKEESIGEVFTWSERSQDFVYTSPLRLDKEGNIRISLVGHGYTDEGVKTFGYMEAPEIIRKLEPLFNKIDPDLVKSIKLDLIGCALLDLSVSIENTIPGKLAEWLNSKSRELGLDSEHWSVVAREHDVKVGANGKKEVFLKGRWIDKEVANTYVQLNKSELIWDKDLGKVTKKPLSKDTLIEISKAIDTSTGQMNELNDESQKLVLELHDLVAKNIRELLQIGERPSEHRTEVEKKIAEALSLITLAGEWNDAVNNLKSEHAMQLGDGWHAMISTQEIDGETHVVFVHESEDKKPVLIKTDDEIFSKFSETYTQLHQDFTEHLTLDTHTGVIDAKPTMLEGDAVHTLNAAFLIQTLLDHHASPSKNLTWPIKLQTYVGLVQPSVGVIEDGIHLGSMIANAMKFEIKPLEQALSAIKTAFPTLNAAGSILPGAIGVIFDAANITGIIGELANSTSQEEAALAATNLTMAGITASVNVGAIAAGLTGAATASSILGMVGIPLVGLSIGIPALVEGYENVAQSANALIDEFNRVYHSVSNPSMLYDASDFSINPSKDSKVLWSLGNGAVVSEVDFINNTVHYGNITTMGTRGGAWHTFTGGLDHYLSGPIPDNGTTLDVYNAFGLSERNKAVDLSYALNFYLPYGANTYYSFGYNDLPGARYKKSIGLDTLRSYYGQKFVWVWYALPGDWIISYLKHSYYHTDIQIKLDNKSRNLFFPILDDNDLRNKLLYKLYGSGGEYLLKLPEDNVKVEITPSQSKSEQWTLDISSIKDIHSGLNEKITMKNSSLYLGDQVIDFKDGIPNEIILYSEIKTSDWPNNGELMADKLSLIVSIDCIKKTKQLTLVFESKNEFRPSMKDGLMRIVKKLNLNTAIPVELKLRSGKTTAVVHKDYFLYLPPYPLNNRIGFFEGYGTGLPVAYDIGPVGLDNILTVDNNGNPFYKFSDNSFSVLLKLIINRGKINAQPYAAVYKSNNLDEAHLKIQDIKGSSVQDFREYLLKNHNHHQIDFPKEFTYTVAYEGDKDNAFLNFMLSFNEDDRLELKTAGWSENNSILSYDYDKNSNLVNIHLKNDPSEIKILSKDLMSDLFNQNTEFVFYANKNLKRLSLPTSQIQTSFILAIDESHKDFDLEINDLYFREAVIQLDGKDLIVHNKANGVYTKLLNMTDLHNFRLKFKDGYYMNSNEIYNYISGITHDFDHWISKNNPISATFITDNGLNVILKNGLWYTKNNGYQELVGHIKQFISDEDMKSVSSSNLKTAFLSTKGKPRLLFSNNFVFELNNGFFNKIFTYPESLTKSISLMVNPYARFMEDNDTYLAPTFFFMRSDIGSDIYYSIGDRYEKEYDPRLRYTGNLLSSSIYPRNKSLISAYSSSEGVINLIFDDGSEYAISNLLRSREVEMSYIGKNWPSMR
ncbi:TcdA/TcdB pore-forming domain-containing protein [Cysteiniphilum sp. 6C5]|uniref:TcdA/TcdB pore-forming domain-containing protein n=1 Tax=unclassified Cysteiniphilum TaxID=2610889 RepID=UPI003F8636AB